MMTVQTVSTPMERILMKLKTPNTQTVTLFMKLKQTINKLTEDNNSHRDKIRNQIKDGVIKGHNKTEIVAPDITKIMVIIFVIHVNI